MDEPAGKSRGVAPAIVIRGLGLASPLGATLDETWQAVKAGRCITTHSTVPLPPIAAQSRVTQLALHVARAALADAGWPASPLTSPDTALVVATSKGPILDWLGHRNPVPPVLSPAEDPTWTGTPLERTGSTPLQHMLYPTYVAGGLHPAGLAGVADDLAQSLAIHSGPRLTISAACASGLVALIRACLMLRAREASRVLVVAVESSIHPLFLGSFTRMRALAPEGAACRPFDQARQGFLMSEAAAAVCIELSTAPRPALWCGLPACIPDPPRPGLCYKPPACIPTIAIEHFALASDATHLTNVDPAGRALRHALTRVIRSCPLDLIHAHGTATLAADPVELAAIDAAVAPGANPPAVYSHKAALGHSLGAAGLVSIVLSCLCHREGIIPPNPQTDRPLPARNVTISANPIRRPIRRSLAIAQGFGGPIAAVSLRTI